jgi:hypothetical protein
MRSSQNKRYETRVLIQVEGKDPESTVTTDGALGDGFGERELGWSCTNKRHDI